MHWLLDDSRHRRALVALAAGALVVGIAGTAAAVTITPLEDEVISLFTGQTADSDLTITSYDTQFQGKDQIKVSVTVDNPDTTDHTGDITVQLLDASDAVLVEDTHASVPVAAGSGTTEKYTFNQDGIVSDYDETMIIIEQTS